MEKPCRNRHPDLEVTRNAPQEVCVLRRPLLDVPLVVLQADADALVEVVVVRNGLQEVSLDQGDVIELEGGGCAGVGGTGVQENLTKPNTHTRDDDHLDLVI